VVDKAKVHFLATFTLQIHSAYRVCVCVRVRVMTVTVAVMTATQLNKNFCNF